MISLPRNLRVVLVGLLLPALAAADVVLYVAPNGNDRANGTEGAPLATVERGVQQARELQATAGGDVHIILRGGVHRFNRTLVLGLADSLPEGRTMSFEAYTGEKPVISGGVTVTGWRRLRPDEGRALPAASRAKVWVADLPGSSAGPTEFRALYDSDRLLPRARSAEYHSRGRPRGLADRLEDRDLLEYPAGALKRWANLQDVEIFSRPNHVWIVNYLGIASLDEATLTARTTVPATYTPTGRFWVENVLEALDEPGEWVLNTTEHRLYLWPRGAEPGDAVTYPVVRTLVRVEGREDYWGNGDEPARGFRFTGLTFSHTDRDVWTPTDAGLQHDWAMWDKDDAAVRFRVARDCEVNRCIFVATAGHGVRADLFAQNIRVTGSTFRQLGASGVLLCGYGPGTKDVNRGNEVTDNEFHDLGTLWWHSPAILLWQSGSNRVTNNYIHDMPYNAVVLSGVRPRHFSVPTPKVPKPTFPPGMREDLRLLRWREIGYPRTVEEILPFAHTRGNLIADNEIRDAMRVLADGNGIYLSSAGKDNVIRRNVIYNMGNAAAIRTDDDQSYCTLTENVTFGVGIVIKDFNATWNNVMINGGLRIVSDRPDSRVERNVYYSYVNAANFHSVDVVNSYFGNAKGDTLLNNYNPDHQPIVPPKTDHNLFYCADRSAAEKFIADARATWGSDTHSAWGDPGFLDAAHGDFRWGPDSPAAALGIRAIDTTHVGLLREPMVQRLKREGGLNLQQHQDSKDKG
jgi:hypothetical protein